MDSTRTLEIRYRCSEESIDEELHRTLINKNLSAFESLLVNARPEDINKMYGPRGTLLSIACEQGMVEFVKLLLENEANVEGELIKVSAIHLAVRNLHSEILELLLQHQADVNCRKSEEQQTPLHVLIREWNTLEVEAKEVQWWKCLDVLLSHPDININAEDFNEVTPLELAVKKKNRFLAKRLISKGAVVNQYVKEAMEEHSMTDLIDNFRNVTNNETIVDEQSIGHELWKALYGSNIHQLQSLLNMIQSGAVQCDLNKMSHKRTMLQFSCRQELVEAVPLLLEAGCDPNLTCFEDPTPPLIIAAQKGSHQILKCLCNQEAIQINITDSKKSKQTALHKIAQRMPINKNCFIHCLEILLEFRGQNEIIEINAQDESGNTALHYAVHTGVEESVLQLLRHGSYLGITNIYGETPIKRILPVHLEAFFDSVVQCSNEEPSSHNFRVTFNYSFLAPPVKELKANIPLRYSSLLKNVDAEVESRTDQIEDIPQHRAFRNQPESEVLWHISRSPKHQHLLKHPLITSFLMLKWEVIRKYYCWNVMIYFSAVAVLVGYILLLNCRNSENYTELIFFNILWYALLCFISFLALRELFQLSIAPVSYICSIENYIEIGMLACASLILIHWQHSTWCRHISAMAVLLASVEVLLLLGRHPRLSTFITMFKTVYLTFLQLLFFYSVLLIGFVFSFFLVFQPTDALEDAGTEASAINGSYFSNIPLSALKVASMMAGELDYGNLLFDVNPWTSRFVFLVFLFSITIVLFNLLNGMAVSDTQAIKDKAEIVSLVSRVELTSYMESMLLGDPFGFFCEASSSRFPCLRHCVSPIGKFLRSKRIQKLLRANRILIFKCLPRQTFTIYPNSQVAYSSNDPDKIPFEMCKCHQNFRLSEDIVQDAIYAYQRTQQSHRSSLLKIEMDNLTNLMQRQHAELVHLLHRKFEEMSQI